MVLDQNKEAMQEAGIDIDVNYVKGVSLIIMK